MEQGRVLGMGHGIPSHPTGEALVKPLVLRTGEKLAIPIAPRNSLV